MILQHRRERFHPFNTARIVNQSLDRCELIVAHNADLSRRFDSMRLSKNVGLLFPGDDARLLTDLAPSEFPDQLVIPDGTWHHVKTLMREVPRLQTLPRFRLAPTSPGRYRIRREPNLEALSTLEATVAALSTLEPDTAGLNDLTEAFDRMVTDQLGNRSSNWRQNERRRPGMPNVPKSLTGDLSNVVVAYGEREPFDREHRDQQQNSKPIPIYWNAMRLVSEDTFRCAIQSHAYQNQGLLRHVRIPAKEIEEAVTLEEFSRRWRQFLRPHDRVAVFHSSTAAILQNVDPTFTPKWILKSIHLNEPPPSIDNQPDPDPLPPSFHNGSRAAQRLANIVDYVQSVNAKFREAT